MKIPKTNIVLPIKKERCGNTTQTIRRLCYSFSPSHRFRPVVKNVNEMLFARLQQASKGEKKLLDLIDSLSFHLSKNAAAKVNDSAEISSYLNE